MIALWMQATACRPQASNAPPPPPSFPSAPAASSSAGAATASDEADEDESPAQGTGSESPSTPSATPASSPPDASSADGMDAGSSSQLPAPPAQLTAFTAAMARARAQRDQAMALLPPRYDGSATPQSLKKFLELLKPWFDAKESLVEAAESGYDAAAQAALWPEQKVEGLAEAAGLWSDFADEIPRTAPLPDSMRSDPEIARAYADALNEALEPMRRKGLALADTCVDVTVASKVKTPAAQKCVEVRDHLKEHLP